MAGLILVGSGPGLGAAIARRFAGEDFDVTAIARGPGADVVVEQVAAAGGRVLGLHADVTDARALRAALDAAVAAHGAPDVVVYNAALIRRDVPGELDAHDQSYAWGVNVGGALTTLAHLTPVLVRRGTGTVLFTGGMPRADARYTSLSLGKAALRALADIARGQLAPHGVHVATVTIDCHMVPGTDSDPYVIAEHYWTLHRQPAEAWQHDVVHHGSTAV